MSGGRYRSLKGVEDVFPPDIFIWQRIESAARETFALYGYSEIRPPIIESTEVFTRSIGENTDIVEKEMYTFPDKADRSITLRPEGTAPVVRAYVERTLTAMPPPQKFYYMGPMFRYERPQKGRLRQFYQIGAEAFGMGGPELDAEVIFMLSRFLNKLGIGNLSFELNSIGCEKCRAPYREALKDFFSPKLEKLCEDCRRRHSQNPLRILDCKVPACKEARTGAPAITDYLCEDCRSHYGELKELLGLAGAKYTENPGMVRGLDYYTGTIFEVTTTALGAQNAVAAGGRYDGLVSSFGGPDTPAVGFALGMERLVELMRDAHPSKPGPDIFIASLGLDATRRTLTLSETLRDRGLNVELGYGSGSLKSQMRRANKLGASYVLIIGEDELRAGRLKWKRMEDGTDGELELSLAGTHNWSA